MKKVLFASVALAALTIAPAFAADPGMPMEEAPLGFSWTGGYIGVQAGYGWGDSSFDDTVRSNSFDIDGFTGGVTLGYNYQFAGNWVAGVEADVSVSGIDGSFGPGNLGAVDGGLWICGSGPCVTDVPWYATARGRLGYAFDRVLVYGTGGLAIGRIESAIENDPDWITEKTKAGWTAGGGVEYAFTDNWTVKAEYLHVDLGWTDRNVASDFKADAEFDTVRLGINYKF